MNSILDHRPSIAIVVALLLWAPSLLAFVHGGLDILPAATRFLIAFGVAWIGVTVLGMIVAGYGQHSSTPGLQRRQNNAGGESIDEELDSEAA